MSQTEFKGMVASLIILAGGAVIVYTIIIEFILLCHKALDDTRYLKHEKECHACGKKKTYGLYMRDKYFCSYDCLDLYIAERQNKKE